MAMKIHILLILFITLLALLNRPINQQWHNNITATVFWVGEEAGEENNFISNVESCFDEKWLEHYGGKDDPKARINYFPSTFIPKENPFYVALPVSEYDKDGNLREEIKEVGPLKNRWVEIVYDGKKAYAQLEDCGPFVYDDFDYVFGDAKPKNHVNHAGIDLSPAVADYLGINGSANVSWRFVDERDVEEGPWKAIITRGSNCYGECNYAQSDINWSYIIKIYRGPPKNLTVGARWYWQLQGKIKHYDVDVYDVDLFDVSREEIQSLRESGKVVICYFSAGTAETFRNDFNEFPKDVLGKRVEEWQDEIWLDVSHYKKFKDIIERRLDMALLKGCDGVELDNVDTYLQDTGFNISPNNQIAYNIWLANESHKRGLLAGLKNDFEQMDELVDCFDFAIVEDCFYYKECNFTRPFIINGKPVFDAEYILTPDEFCEEARKLNISAIHVPLDLDGDVDFCPV